MKEKKSLLSRLCGNLATGVIAAALSLGFSNCAQAVPTNDVNVSSNNPVAGAGLNLFGVKNDDHTSVTLSYHGIADSLLSRTDPFTATISGETNITLQNTITGDLFTDAIAGLINLSFQPADAGDPTGLNVLNIWVDNPTSYWGSQIFFLANAINPSNYLVSGSQVYLSDKIAGASLLLGNPDLSITPSTIPEPHTSTLVGLAAAAAAVTALRRSRIAGTAGLSAK